MFLYISLFNIGPGNVDTLFVALLLLLEGLGEVSHLTIFRSPSWSFWEASWVRVRPASSLFTASQHTNSENVVQDGQEVAVIIAMTASHILDCYFFISSESLLVTHLADFFLFAAEPCGERREPF
jgi:hypothetical protein